MIVINRVKVCAHSLSFALHIILSGIVKVTQESRAVAKVLVSRDGITLQHTKKEKKKAKRE
jgi:hypothetical protein